MPASLIDTAQALDLAIEAHQIARRKKLQRAVRKLQIRTRVALSLSGCLTIIALAAVFLIGDYEAALIIAAIAFLTFGMTYVVGNAGIRKAVDSLKAADQSI